jgi:hypothetical protein
MRKPGSATWPLPPKIFLQISEFSTIKNVQETLNFGIKSPEERSTF